ncbi:hypothetical protein H1O16_gp320 [Burkholderia phage BcepSaruman]|uniref:Uncharacterized protein n=1 Tax=Burkholderia phage BcepSaruman TaxID=2530032 RepID=A0A4D5ZCF8_9CAUD|nr:hypothetical protein H1O16_gp320 [Burkholderia phage BcepSaruman]QBX06733.1 hypothetical protein BcepSaruman_320 [Burkholderia phage BcepSaruman]
MNFEIHYAPASTVDGLRRGTLMSYSYLTGSPRTRPVVPHHVYLFVDADNEDNQQLVLITAVEEEDTGWTKVSARAVHTQAGEVTEERPARGMSLVQHVQLVLDGPGSDKLDPYVRFHLERGIACARSQTPVLEEQERASLKRAVEALKKMGWAKDYEVVKNFVDRSQ